MGYLSFCALTDKTRNEVYADRIYIEIFFVDALEVSSLKTTSTLYRDADKPRTRPYFPVLYFLIDGRLLSLLMGISLV